MLTKKGWKTRNSASPMPRPFSFESATCRKFQVVML